MFIPNSKLDTMELLYPKRKPIGRVKIDWSHPLARGLRNVFCISGLDQLTPLTRNLLEGSPGFAGIEVENEVSWIRETDFYSISFGVIPADMTRSSLIFSAFKAELDSWRDTDNIAIWLDDVAFGSGATSCISFGAPAILGGRVETTTGSVVEGKMNHITCLKNGFGYLGDALCYIGGVNVTQANQKFAATTPARIDGIARIGKAPHSLSYPLLDPMHYLYFHDRPLSEVEIKSLHDNPYQFLIPA